ncbi:hypothetical protein EVAR_41845_1 [Eumeta japonica]|uniref:Uncharacterized protein n=1 Tax=Eumeta variegata TaxID=151549 RepID=A0A4C1XDA8_EUMVA|nr:hypothetical protein EVAR_41845_1 [Eumeta japonica]
MSHSHLPGRCRCHFRSGRTRRDLLALPERACAHPKENLHDALRNSIQMYRFIAFTSVALSVRQSSLRQRFTVHSFSVHLSSGGAMRARRGRRVDGCRFPITITVQSESREMRATPRTHLLCHVPADAGALVLGDFRAVSISSLAHKRGRCGHLGRPRLYRGGHPGVARRLLLLHARLEHCNFGLPLLALAVSGLVLMVAICLIVGVEKALCRVMLGRVRHRDVDCKSSLYVKWYRGIVDLKHRLESAARTGPGRRRGRKSSRARLMVDFLKIS